MYIDDPTRLHHMLDAARKAVENVSGRDRRDLDQDENLGIVLTHWIQVLGEAARLVSSDLKARHPEVPWARIQGCAIASCMTTRRSILTLSGTWRPRESRN
jgi:uncharacterized protein with HEPN domain